MAVQPHSALTREQRSRGFLGGGSEPRLGALGTPGAGPRRTEVDAAEQDHIRDRLQNLRTVVPVLAEELASARRQTAELRRENDRLVQRIRDLQRSSSPRR